MSKLETEYCRFLGKLNENGSITIRPVAIARNSIDNPMASGWQDVVTEIVVDEEYAKGLDGLEDYSHVIVIYWFDKEKECHIKHHPQGKEDVPFVGIFACRCPQRPNSIGISTVELLERSGNVLKVRGLDILDGTPILDIKPFTPQYDIVEKFKTPGWINRLKY